ncbi:MAG TPA: peptidyl-prolyl cis-trans isomerase [Vulgatibacter sp.]|nr:peptidyl-prolyl cis-trans isomerase [Vulgatibacter sp.]
MIKNAQTIAAVVLAAASLVACGQKAEEKAEGAAEKKAGDVVASLGDITITVDELKAKMDEQAPFIRARYDTTERKREFLDNMIRFELLAQEAKRRGFENDPEVQSAMKKTMVQKLMRAEFDDSKDVGEIPESELRAFYDANITDYVKPERARMSHVFFAAAKNDPNRAKVRAEANKALAALKAKDADKNAFAELAKTRSDDNASKRAGGDLSFKTKEELTEAWGAEVTKAAFELKEIGDLASVVETEKGFHLVKLTGRQNALDRPFDSVKNQIMSRLSREKRTKAFDAFVEGLKENAKVEVNEELLASIQVNTEGAPQLPPGLAPQGGARTSVQAVPAQGAAKPVVVPAKGADAKPEAK